MQVKDLKKTSKKVTFQNKKLVGKR